MYYVGIDPGVNGAIAVCKKKGKDINLLLVKKNVYGFIEKCALINDIKAQFPNAVYGLEVARIFGRYDKNKLANIEKYIRDHQQLVDALLSCKTLYIDIHLSSWQEVCKLYAGISNNKKIKYNNNKDRWHQAVCNIFKNIEITKYSADAVGIAYYLCVCEEK